MQTVSTALRNAIDAGNPQRVLLIFGQHELSNEDIVMSTGIELSEEFNSDEDLTIGSTPSAILTFALLNDNNQLEDFEFGWFTAYLGAKIDGETETELTRMFVENGNSNIYAFVPLGTFYAKKPKVIRKKTISITAYDKMTIFDVDMPSSADLQITYPTTIGTILQRICSYANVSTVSETFLNSTLEVPSEPKDIRLASIRQVIGWIAECACSVARFNREGNLEFAWFNTTQVSYDEHNYKEFTPAWYETHAVNGLYVRDTDTSKEDVQGDTRTNNYLIQDNPFLRG